MWPSRGRPRRCRTSSVASGRGSSDAATGSGSCWCIATGGRWRRLPPHWWGGGLRFSGRPGCRGAWKSPGRRPPTSSCWRPPSRSGSWACAGCPDSPLCWPWAKFHRGCQRRRGAPLYLPASRSPMPYCTPSRDWTSFRGEGGQGVTGGKVLIVEDNPVNLRLAQFLLEKKGFIVRKAGSGAECLAEMARELPDIVLMDIQLPSEDGLAVTRKIRSDPRLAGGIVGALAAHGMAGDRERILAAGCDGYIPKPVDPRGLPGEVARYLEQGRLKTA